MAKRLHPTFARMAERSAEAEPTMRIRCAARTDVMARFIGYTVQQYITKTIRNEKRATVYTK